MMKKIILGLFAVVVLSPSSFAAATRGSAIVAQASKATVRTKVDAAGLYDQECYDAYFGCMDQFCQSDNESGGSCMCSADYSRYESTMSLISKNNDEANRIKTIEVEKVQAGANADILFNGSREYDNSGNVVTQDKKDSVASRRAARKIEMDKLMSLDGEEEEVEDTLEGKTGKALYDGARALCLEQVPESCSKDMTLLTNVYLTQVRNDCTALSKVIGELQKKSELALLDAQKEVRNARDAKFEEDNEYDRGTCMVEFKKCMKTEDACGTDWNRCVDSLATENMQNNTAVSTAGTRVSHTDKFDITDSVQEMLSSKRNICEKVLNKCMAARDFVWDDFLRDVAPELKIAENKAESGKRQSCLTSISDCIQKACKDDIAGKGTATMDSCLARPEMARSFCKIEIDPCERMEPQIWDYVVSKLAAMRVDACTNEVKDCFESDDRCGKDFSKCIGMDYKFMHDMCPVDKLVVCKQSKSDFKMADIDNMLMGFFLNVDNKALDLCQEKIDKKMMEICGSTTDCNKFAADDVIGTGSLQSIKDGDVYRISGMLSFGMIKMGNGTSCNGVNDEGECEKENTLPYGKIGVDDYIAEVKKKNTFGNIELINAAIDSVDAELKNIEGTINRTIDVLESDTEIQFCTKGRDLSQINGSTSRNNVTTARFPNLLNNQKMLIAASALRKAQTNYQKKYNEMVTKATKDASADIAQVICHQMGSGNGGGGKAEAEVSLIPPFSIMVEIGRGVGLNRLLAGSTGSSSSSASGSTKETQAGISLTNIGYNSSGTRSEGNVTTKTRAIFTRDTRNCHYCSQVSTISCSSSKSNGFFGIGGKSSSECKTKAEPEKCEDIAM
jgi:hypothetical protein